MKGTFISADFAQDLTGSLKFLEINTDTTANEKLYSGSNCWDGLFQLISGSTLTGETITEFHVVYKPSIQEELVENLSQSLNESSVHQITTYTEHREELETIYPTSVEDANYKFILRLAYDENAILDSNYCKDSVSALMLFKNNNNLNEAVPFWVLQGSNVHDGLQNVINDSKLPDVVRKYQSTIKSVNFAKIANYYSGSEFHSGSEFDSNRFTELKNQISSSAEVSDSFLMNYMYPTASINEGRMSTIRSYHIIYGSSLSSLDIGVTRTYSSFTLPTQSVLPELDITESYQGIERKHYYEFSTSTMKENNYAGNIEGVYETEYFVSESNELLSGNEISQSLIANETVKLKSYFINGLPNSDSPAEYLVWSHEGNTLPSGSYATSSLALSGTRKDMNNNKIHKITLEGNTTSSFIGPRANLLVYDSASNETRFQPINSLDANRVPGYYTYNDSGSLNKIEKNEVYILNYNTGSFYAVNVESDDIVYTTFGDTISTSLIGLHNFTCFAAGTQISLANGDVKNIEDIVVGDLVIGWNGESLDTSEVTAIDHRHTVGSHADACKQLGDEPSLYTINNTGIEFTPEHPFLTKEGWKSLVPNPAESPYDIQKPMALKLGDYINVNGLWEEVKEIKVVRSDADERVYNISVKDLHSYIADGIIVHNKDQE